MELNREDERNIKIETFTSEQELPMEKSPHVVCLFSPAALLVRSFNKEYFAKRNFSILERRLARKSKTTNPKK